MFHISSSSPFPIDDDDNEKICADMNKPDGQFECPCTRQGVMAFMDTLPTRKLGGIGKVQEKLLSSLGRGGANTRIPLPLPIH